MKYYPESKVEIKGVESKIYDVGLDIITLGTYASFIKKVLESMNIKPEDKILDMGAGTGRNACLMRRYLHNKGEIIGLDIGKEMIDIFKKRCSSFKNVRVLRVRIDQKIPFENYFTKVFISFVIHGFPQEIREIIIDNAYRALIQGGEFFILDYSEFDVEKIFFPAKILFKKIECSYAFDFIKRDFKNVLKKHKFRDIEEKFFYKGYIRLLKSKKEGGFNG